MFLLMAEGLLRGALIVAGIIWALGAASIAAMVRDDDNDSRAALWLRHRRHPDLVAILLTCFWPAVLVLVVLGIIVCCAGGYLLDLARRRA